MSRSRKDPIAQTLTRLDACADAIKWAETQPTYVSAWCECRRGDWLLWLAAKLKVDRRLVVQAACACARLALPYVPAGEHRPRIAIETAEAWCQGNATIDEVRAAAAAAFLAAAYAAAADAADAAYAAYAAYYAAAYVAGAATYVSPAAYAADAAYYAAYYAATYAGARRPAVAGAATNVAFREQVLAQCADEVRYHIPYAKIRVALRRTLNENDAV